VVNRPYVGPVSPGLADCLSVSSSNLPVWPHFGPVVPSWCHVRIPAQRRSSGTGRPALACFRKRTCGFWNIVVASDLPGHTGIPIGSRATKRGGTRNPRLRTCASRGQS